VTDLRRLQYFLAVARERNFTRAAEQRQVVQRLTTLRRR
jgi:DNA-binding transcriptional LysR family regulator